MFWPPFVFNLCVALLLAAYLLRAVRRFERRADIVMAKLDQWEATQLAKIDQEYQDELRKYDLARDEIRASMRAKVDRAIAEMQADPLVPLPAVSGPVIVPRPRMTLGPVTVSEPVYVPPTLDSIPTEEEIRELPRWAQVAFAARCARRILALTRYVRSRNQDKMPGVVEAVVEKAEKAAANAEASKPRTLDEARFLSHAYWENDPQDKAGAEALSSIRCAEVDAENQDTVIRASAAANHAASAGSLIADITPIIRSDFDHLSRLAGWNRWDSDTPVPPSHFGPLWPEGAPRGWPKPERPTPQLVFAFDVPDDMTTADAVELAKELSAALCELDLAGGGHGLAIQPPLEITAPVRTGSRV